MPNECQRVCGSGVDVSPLTFARYFATKEAAILSVVHDRT
jgi:hypothetical protein